MRLFRSRPCLGGCGRLRRWYDRDFCESCRAARRAEVLRGQW